jgi:two-component system NtrC family sensor kinase
LEMSDRPSMIRKPSTNISRALTWAVGIILGMLAVVLPAGYYVISYQNMAGNLEALVEDIARELSQVITENPDVWEYQQIRYMGYLSQRPWRGHEEARRIVNNQGKIVAEHSDPLSPPLVRRSAEVYDSGTAVGRLEIYRSMRPILTRTVILALVAVALSSGAFLLMRKLPLHAIKVSEESLRASEARFRRLSQEFHVLLNATSDALLLVSRDLKVVWANKSASSLFEEVEAPDLTGRHCYDIMHQRSGPCQDCYLIRSFSTGLTESFSYSSRGGRLLEARAFPITEEDGEMRNALAVITDITERTALQAEASRAGHLASLGELAAGIAHEINNPINGVINYAQLLVNKSPEGSRENDLAGRIVQEGDRIARIVRGLLSFARENTDEKSACSLQKIIDDTVMLTAAQLRHDGIRVQVNVPEEIDDIIANPQQIQQVFLNIMSNARHALNLKYSGAQKDKTLSISCENIVMGRSPFARTTFYDRGTGIPAEVLDKVMVPFFSTKPSGQGTGLGLSITHNIVKDHGGRIMIESEEGIYTRVIVDLPARREVEGKA